MPRWGRMVVARSARRLLPLVAPAEWRIVTSGAGLCLVEQNQAGAWRLQAVLPDLCRAFNAAQDLYEDSHWLGRRIARLAPDADADVAGLPEAYRVRTDEGWQGKLYRSAVEDTSFGAEAAPGLGFDGSAWRAARADGLAILREGGVLLVLGAAGTGKSVLLRELADALNREGRPARVFPAGEALAAGPDAPIMLFDDAERLSQEMLAALLFVDAPVALAALPGFERRLEGMRRVPNVVWIEPLGLEDVARFVAARFRSAGRPPALLDPEAVLRLARYSEGVPARLQRLAGAAVFFADLECAPRIGCDHVELAAAVGRGLRGAARPVPALPAARPLRSKPLQARLAPLAAAVAGFALVGATSWTARWMGGHAESAQTEPADGPAMELAAGPGALEASVAVAAGPKPDEVPLRPEERRVTGESGFDAEFSLSKTELEEGVGLMAGSLGAAGVRSGIEPDQGLETPGELGAFRGRVHNETLGLSGKLSVVLVRTGTGVKARFHAWDGLLGTGELAVKTSADGRIAASGQLLMGKNPFLCSLNGVIRGNRFIGRAEFVRPWGGPVAHSSFDLLRSES